MSSQIKFRAWDIDEECFIPQDHFAVFADGGGKWRKFLSYDSEVDEFRSDPIDIIIEQWTGLLDKNGVEIYEGDIVSLNDCTTARVDFSGGSFNCLTKSVFSHQLIECSTLAEWENIEVIGNVHENPELLEQQ